MRGGGVSAQGRLTVRAMKADGLQPLYLLPDEMAGQARRISWRVVA